VANSTDSFSTTTTAQRWESRMIQSSPEDGTALSRCSNCLASSSTFSFLFYTDADNSVFCFLSQCITWKCQLILFTNMNRRLTTEYSYFHYRPPQSGFVSNFTAAVTGDSKKQLKWYHKLTRKNFTSDGHVALGIMFKHLTKRLSYKLVTSEFCKNVTQFSVSVIHADKTVEICPSSIKKLTALSAILHDLAKSGLEVSNV
jgi:hypothetical protein